MPKNLRAKDLIPFRRRRNAYKLPKMGKEEEEQIIDAVDPNLKPEEQGFVRHYLGYADVFLGDEAKRNDRRASDNPQSSVAANPEATKAA